MEAEEIKKKLGDSPKTSKRQNYFNGLITDQENQSGDESFRPRERLSNSKFKKQQYHRRKTFSNQYSRLSEGGNIINVTKNGLSSLENEFKKGKDSLREKLYGGKRKKDTEDVSETINSDLKISRLNTATEDKKSRKIKNNSTSLASSLFHSLGFKKGTIFNIAKNPKSLPGKTSWVCSKNKGPGSLTFEYDPAQSQDEKLVSSEPKPNTPYSVVRSDCEE